MRLFHKRTPKTKFYLYRSLILSETEAKSIKRNGLTSLPVKWFGMEGLENKLKMRIKFLVEPNKVEHFTDSFDIKKYGFRQIPALTYQTIDNGLHESNISPWFHNKIKFVIDGYGDFAGRARPIEKDQKNYIIRITVDPKEVIIPKEDETELPNIFNFIFIPEKDEYVSLDPIISPERIDFILEVSIPLNDMDETKSNELIKYIEEIGPRKQRDILKFY